MLQRTFEPAPDQPAVKGIVAVLDQDSSLGETKERPTRVTEFRGSDQHRPIDVVPLLRIGIDRCLAIDQRVEKRKRTRQRESLRAKLEHKEGGVASRFHVDGHELCLVEQRLRTELGRVDCDLFPRDRLCRPARL